MASNRVIGAGGGLPWRLAEDLAWFKRQTMGHGLLMGRKTFESLGRALPGRACYVLSRRMPPVDGVTILRSLNEVPPDDLEGRDLYVCGGGEIYSALLPLCQDLFLTELEREFPGDTVFPPFEHMFEEDLVMEEGPGFRIVHYVRRDDFRNAA